jgi:ribonuclease E
MTKRMLIDATHAEETRVVILDGNRLEDFDVETSTKKQIKGNIYLAKVIRVEPSLQAAFVEYGGNRHGFLAFSEIHPDYYQIPVADRQRLLDIEADEAQAEEDAEAAEDAAQERAAAGHTAPEPEAHSAPITSEFDAMEPAFEAAVFATAEDDGETSSATDEDGEASPATDENGESGPRIRAQPMEMAREIVISREAPPEPSEEPGEGAVFVAAPASAEEDAPEIVGGTDNTDESNERRPPPRFMRNYKIQEVIHRRQIMLIQVVKEERGTKGAALTTYLSLAGRYCVLMPNSPRGGGVSRKITSVADRKRLREVIKEVDMPRGMGLIVRTAGANRPKPEIRRDCEYLLRLWDDIREMTLKSVAPSLIYEEASLIKRAIRDGYTRDIEEVLVDGEDGWKAARDFMRMLTPQHASKVQLWRGSDMSLFAKNQVELQLDAMLSPTVQLKSGGYLVINQTEALVAIDVNSGRSTRERNIEETAVRTNLEAAEETARQLRLRDLAGLVVIDFIDMESRKHIGMVERRLKDALKNDRARIQVGSISHFGLMAMSRQRLRPSLNETSFVTCPHCLGVGTVRSVESSAIHILRAIEDEGARRRSAEIAVHLAGAVAMYILNHKRDRLSAIERTHGMQVILLPDDKLVPPQIRLEKIRAYVPGEAPALAGAPIAMDYAARVEVEAEDEDRDAPEPVVARPVLQAEAVSEASGTPAGVPAAPAEPGQRADGDSAGGRRRRRRRRRGGRREENGDASPQNAADGSASFEDGEGDDFESGNEDGLEAADPIPAPQEPAVPPRPAPVPGPGPEIPSEPGRGPELPPPGGPEPELPGVPGEPGPDIVPPIGPTPEMPQPVAFADGDSDGEGASRSRRGRRGGRGRSRLLIEDETPIIEPRQPELSYRGPTPADPYAGQIDALFASFDDVDTTPVSFTPRTPVAAPVPVAPAVVAEPEPVVEPESIAVPEAPLAVEEAAAAPAPVADVAATLEEAEALPAAKAPRGAGRVARPRKAKLAPVEITAQIALVETPAEAVVAETEIAAEPVAPRRRRASPRVKVVEAAAEPVAEIPVVDATVMGTTVTVAETTPAPAAVAPVIQPIVIGEATPAAAKRTGWWKR